jgi:CRISPR system Cascade subunit CasE
MYLSRLTLNLSHPVVARAAGDLHALHRLVLQGFPDVADGGPGRVLHRLERSIGPHSLPMVIVQSEKRADWTSLEALTIQIDGPKEYAPAHTAGQTLRFRLRATPTKKSHFGETMDKPGSRRVGFFTEREQREWLERKGTECHELAGGGFDLIEVRVTALGWQTGKNPKGGTIRHHAVEFDGLLRVTDAEAFAKALAGGVGAAKGFGFGLLSVARLA